MLVCAVLKANHTAQLNRLDSNKKTTESLAYSFKYILRGSVME